MKILLRPRYTSQQRILFFRQLAVILQSGLPLLQGMELLRQRVDKSMALVCYRLQQRLARGSTLAEAAEQEQDFFPLLAVRLIAAGEASGELKQVLEQAAAYYAGQEELKSFILKAAAYPCFLLVLSCCVLLLFLLYILPVLATAYAAMGMGVTGMLAWLLRLQQALTAQPLLTIVLAGAGLLLVSAGLKRLWHWFTGCSWSSNFYRLLYEVRFCKLAALLLDSGMSITQSLVIIAATMEQQGYKRQLQLLNSRLQRGIAIETAATGAAGFLSPLTMDLLTVGAATGSMPQMLREAAVIGEQDLRERLSKFKEFLVPVLLLLAALLIGAVVCAVVGPLFEMLSALPENN